MAASEKLKAEALVQRCSVKKVFLKISYAKSFFCEFCEIFKNTFFHRIPPVAASKKAKNRSSRLEVFCKKGVLRNFVNSLENTCARVSFLQS